MTHQQAHRLLVAGSILGFLVAILGLVGELLGWWDLAGEVLMAGGTLAGLVLASVDLLRGASEAQVEGIDETLDSVDAKLGTMDTKLDKLETIDEKMDRQTVVLEQIRDRL